MGFVDPEDAVRKKLLEFRNETGARFRLARLLVQTDQNNLAWTLGELPEKVMDIEAGKFDTQEICFLRMKQKYGLNMDWLWTGSGNVFDRKGPETPRQVYLAACYAGAGYAIPPTLYSPIDKSKNLLMFRQLISPESFNLSAAFRIKEQSGITHLVVIDHNEKVLYYHQYANSDISKKDFYKRFRFRCDSATTVSKESWSKWYLPEWHQVTEVLLKISGALEIGALTAWKTGP